MTTLIKMNHTLTLSSRKEYQIKKIVKYGCILLIIGSAFYFFYPSSVNAVELLKEKKDTFIINNTEYQKLYKTFDFRNTKKTSIPLKGIGRILGDSNKGKIIDIFEKTKDIELNFPENLNVLQVTPIIRSIPTMKLRKIFFFKGGATGLLISSIVNIFNQKKQILNKIEDENLSVDQKETGNSDVSYKKKIYFKDKIKKIIPYLYNFRTPVPYILISGVLIYFNRGKIASYIDVLALKLADYLDLSLDKPDFEPDIKLIEKYYERYEHPRWFSKIENENPLKENSMGENITQIFKPSKSFYHKEDIF